jgi:hypothetical protein
MRPINSTSEPMQVGDRVAWTVDGEPAQLSASMTLRSR